MGEGDRPPSGDLTAKQGHHRTGRAEHVAETNHRITGTSVLGGRHLKGAGLHDQFGDTLAGTHHIGGPHRFIGGNQHHLADAAASSHLADEASGENVVGEAREGVGLHQGDVLVGSGMEQHADGVPAEEVLKKRRIGSTAKHRLQGDTTRKAAAQLLMNRIETGFAEFEQHQALGAKRQDLAAEFGTDRTTGTGDADTTAGNAGAEQLWIGGDRIAPEQFLDRNRAQGINASPAAADLVHRGHLQDRNAEILKVVHDAATPQTAEGGNRQQHLIQVGLVLPQHLGRADRNAVDIAPPELGGVIDEPFNAVGTSQAEGSGELGTGGAGSVDRHPDQGMARLVLQAEEQITQREAHDPGEAGEQHPEQQPAAAGRQGPAQHQPRGSQQQNQQAIATGKAVESKAAHVAGEALVLAGEGIQGEADQERRRQQPNAAEQVITDRIGQAQPEAEPHRQGNQEGIGNDEQQAALERCQKQQSRRQSAQGHQGREARANGRATRRSNQTPTRSTRTARGSTDWEPPRRSARAKRAVAAM